MGGPMPSFGLALPRIVLNAHPVESMLERGIIRDQIAISFCLDFMIRTSKAPVVGGRGTRARIGAARERRRQAARRSCATATTAAGRIVCSGAVEMNDGKNGRPPIYGSKVSKTGRSTRRGWA